MTNIKVKVKVTALIAEIEKQKAKAEASNAKSKAATLKKFDEWKAKVRKHLETAKPEDAHYNMPNWYPERAQDISRFDKDINLLKMSADEEIVITGSSDFYRYLS